MTMKFQDNEVIAGWDEIFARDANRLKIAEIQDNYPDKKSLFVPYSDIDSYSPDVAIFMLENPDRAIELGWKALRGLLPPTWDPADRVNIRITELPRDANIDVRQIRSKHLGRLVAVEGMVRKATLPKPRMTVATYRCAKCDAEIKVEQRGMYLREPIACPNEGCNRTAMRFNLDEVASVYTNTQRVEIQENPEGLRGGAQPERLAGFIDDDIAGVITPGNRVTLNGIIRTVQKADRDKSTVFDVFMDVMSIQFKHDQNEYDEIQITEEDEIRFQEMSKNPDLISNIVRSISPTIYGLDTEKEAIALQLFGGSHKVMDDGTSIRGDIHILLIGDPGVAKSQLLRYMSNLAPRGIYASGKSASAAGLCVHGDTMLLLEEGSEKIADFVNSRMTEPEEYRPGIWRQKTDAVRVKSVAELGSVRILPVTYVWKIKTPEKMIRLTTVAGDSLMLTPETKVQAMQGAKFDWIPASELHDGDFVSTVKENMRMLMLQSVEEVVDDLPDYVYDLTVDPSHSFIGSGFVIHNTAAAVKDDFGDGRWTLEAGALVLADRGLACIDELDKMSDQDRSSLHEAMESQRISVAKAGITATLQCRCSLLAAANPKFGRFDETSEVITTQINLPPALMSRFDLMFVLTDKPDAKRDKNITQHILMAHRRGQVMMQTNEIAGVDTEAIMNSTDAIRPVYDEDTMRKYVAYSKRIVPIMTKEATDVISEDYLSIRKMGEGSNKSIPITARQLEAYVRLSEASARARLSQTVDRQDAERAVRLVRYYLEKIAGTGDGSFDMDKAYSNVSQRQRDGRMMLKTIIMRNNSPAGMDDASIIDEMSNEGFNEEKTRELLNFLSDQSEVYYTVTDGKRLYKWVG